MIFEASLIHKVSQIHQILLRNQLKITCAESCTGGLLSALFTENSGASQIFERGFVVYSNLSKSQLIAVDNSLIEKYGVVSKEVAIEMSRGALKNSQADIAIAITGYIDLVDKATNPQSGEVFIAIAHQDYCESKKFIFPEDRTQNRQSCLHQALNMLENFFVNNYNKTSL